MKRENSFESILVYCLVTLSEILLSATNNFPWICSSNQFPASFTCQSPNAKLLHNSLRIKLKSKVAFQALKRLPLHSLNCLKTGLKPCFVYLKISSALQMREEGNSSGSAMDTTTTTVASISTTPDEATYIAQHLGAQHLPLTTIIPISVVYSIIFIVGVLGNVSTICVILKNKYMHTPTNVYLANLALSDLLTHLVGN